MQNRRSALLTGLALAAPALLTPGVAMAISVPRKSRWDKLRESGQGGIIHQAWRNGVLVASEYQSPKWWGGPDHLCPADMPSWDSFRIRLGEQHKADFIVSETLDLTISKFLVVKTTEPICFFPVDGSWRNTEEVVMFGSWSGSLA
jgi:hypothetical protein